MTTTMTAAFLPGDSTVEMRTCRCRSRATAKFCYASKPPPSAAPTSAPSIMSILAKPEGYQGVIAGHEPSGQIVSTGPGCRRFKIGDRVIVYHISGCGVCNDCRRGYMISCTSEEYRRAYGWQRDGGMAEYMVAEEKDLIALPDQLSYGDGAQVACGFGTVYEGLEKIASTAITPCSSPASGPSVSPRRAQSQAGRGKNHWYRRGARAYGDRA